MSSARPGSRRGVRSSSARRARRAVVERLELRSLLSAAFAVTGLDALRADPAFAGIDGSGITVAVLDTGVYGSHPDLVGNFLGYVDTVRQPASRATFVTAPGGSVDPGGHGTHVAGTIASTNPAIGVANAAKFIGIRALLAKGESAEDHDGVTEGLRWVLMNHRQFDIRVVNMSLGDSRNVDAPIDNGDARLIRELEAAGVTVVTANGNSYAEYLAPGAADPAINSTIAVVATWEDSGVGDVIPRGSRREDGSIAFDANPRADQIAMFSQRSSLPNQLAAPGATIFSTWNGGDGDAYKDEAGTSMACPFVAGVVALLQDAAQTFGGSYLTPASVLSILRNTGDTIIDAQNPDTYIEFEDGSRTDLPETGLSFSRVNVYRAVQAVKALYVTPAGDADHTLARAYPFPVLEPGDGWVLDDRSVGLDGSLDVGARDVDLYRLELLAPSSLSFSLASNSSARFLARLFGSDGSAIADYTDPSGKPDVTTVQLPKGVYFLGVSGEGNNAYDPTDGSGAVASPAGAYTLTVSADAPDPDGGVFGATDVELLAVTDFSDTTNTGYVSVSGVVGTDGTDQGAQSVGTADVDFFAFVAPDTGTVELDLVAPDGSALDPFLAAFDGEGNRLAFDDDSGGGLDATLLLPVVKGATYYVGVSSAQNTQYNPFTPVGGSAGAGATSGAYHFFLEFSNGDANGTALKPVTLATGSVQGVVGNDAGVTVGAGGTKDVDFYVFTAPSAGQFAFSVSGAFASSLGLYRYDAAQDQLLEIGTSDGNTHELRITAGAGDAFWLAVTGRGNEDFDWYVPGSGSGGATGAYTLSASVASAAATDDAIAGARTFPSSGRATGTLGRDGAALRLDTLNDVDLFRYTAPSAGRLTLRVDGIGDLAPDVFLRVFDAQGNELAFNDDASDLTTDSALTMTTTAGQVLFFGVSAFGSDPRAYNPVTGTGATGGDDAGDYLVQAAHLPFPVLTAIAPAADEGAPVTLTVSIPAASSLPVSVRYATRDGSALAGTNYQPSSGVLTIPAGQTSASVQISTLADGSVSGDRSFSLDLSQPSNAALPTTATVTATVRNTDVIPDGPDLTAEVYFLPASLPPGATKNRIGVSFSNEGTLAFRTTSVRLNLYASTDGTFDASDRLISTSLQRLSLRPDQSRFVTLNVASPSNVPDGDYRVIAVIDAEDVLDERDEGNNIGVSESTTRITQPFVDLRPEIVSLPATVALRGRAFATVRVVNSGNVAATGSLLTTLLSSATGPGSLDAAFAGSLTRKLNLRPGQALTLRIPMLRPVTPGAVFVGASLNYSAPLADRDPSNNTTFSDTPVTFA